MSFLEKPIFFFNNFEFIKKPTKIQLLKNPL